MRNRIAVGLATIALGTVIATACAIVIRPTALPACATEDSVSCYWDASTRGNGIGRSFVVDANGVRTFTN